MIPGPRTREITRVEGFSDAVFGFALTLLVVSLEVPGSYAELMAAMRGFLPFACCFAIVVWIWYEHNPSSGATAFRTATPLCSTACSSSSCSSTSTRSSSRSA